MRLPNVMYMFIIHCMWYYLLPLLSIGAINLDYSETEKENGKKRADREKDKKWEEGMG